MAAGEGVLLVPTDFEAGSRKALELAKELSPRLGAEVVLVHVYQLPVYTYPGLEPALLPGFHGEVLAAATRAITQFAAEQGIARWELREGDPAHEILEAARKLDARMIAMGTHGRSGLSHLFLGSVAETVVRKSSVPVLTLRVP